MAGNSAALGCSAFPPGSSCSKPWLGAGSLRWEQHLCGTTQGPEPGLGTGSIAPGGFQASRVPRPGEGGWERAAGLLGPCSSPPWAQLQPGLPLLPGVTCTA